MAASMLVVMPWRVLIAEAQADRRRQWRRALHGDEFALFEACNEAELMRLTRIARPDLVLLGEPWRESTAHWGPQLALSQTDVLPLATFPPPADFRAQVMARLRASAPPTLQ
jgi:hypothetical protein